MVATLYGSLVNVLRAGSTVLTNVSVEIQGRDELPFEVPQQPVRGETLYDKYTIITQQLPMPDIRPRDQLIDQVEIDPFTATNALYRVKRVHKYSGTIYAERVATTPTTTS